MNNSNSYYQRNRERLSKNSKERVQEQARSKYREIANEEKEIKREYGRNRYINISEEDEKNYKNNIHFHL